MHRLSAGLAIIGALASLGSKVLLADDGTERPRVYTVACKYIEIDAKDNLERLARPQVTMLEGQEAVVQTGGPEISFPAHLKERLRKDIPIVPHGITRADERDTNRREERTATSATKWQIEVSSVKAGKVLLDATIKIAEVESADESGALISTQELRVLRRVPLDKPVSFDLPRGNSKTRRIEFLVSEVKRSASR